MRNKQVEFNPYIYIDTNQSCPVLAMKYPFFNAQQGGIQNSRRNRQLIRHDNRFTKEWLPNIFFCS